MYLVRLRRHMAVVPVALTLGLLLAAGPALAQPASGKTDSHSATPDDPGLGMPALPAEDGAEAPAPAPASALWFYIQDGQKKGPVSTADLRQMLLDGKVQTANKVWRTGMAGWLPLRTLPEFADMAPPPTPEEERASETRRVVIKTDTGPQPERIRHKAFIVPGVIVFGATWMMGIVSAIFASEEGDDEIYDPVTGGITTRESPESKYAKLGWLPLAGPIAGYANAGGDDNRVIAVMVLWSAAQAAGLGLFIAGMVGKKNPNYSGDEAGITIGPLLGQVNGMGLTGRF